MRVVYCPNIYCVVYWHNTVYKSFNGHCFSSFSASFLIEAVGCRELGGALIEPAGWQHLAIKLLREPSIHQSGKILNPPEHTLPLLPISSLSLPHPFLLSILLVCFHPLVLKPASHTQTKCYSLSGVLLMVVVSKRCYSGLSLILSPLCFFFLFFCLFSPLKLTHTQSLGPFYISTHVRCLGAKILSYSFRDSIVWSCNGIHHYTDGSSFPSPAPTLWMGND